MATTTAAFACGGNQAYRSTDKGQTWAFLHGFGTGLSGIEPLENGIAVAGYSTGTYLGSMQRTTDYGDTWGSVSGISNYTYSQPCYLGNGVVVVGTLNSGSGGSIFRSVDYGATWSNVYPSGQRKGDAAYLGNDTVIVGGLNGSGLYRSINAGATWAYIQSFGGLYVFHPTSLGNGVALVGIGDTGTIWRSTDYGATWTNLGQQFGQSSIRSFADAGSGIVLAGTYPNGYILRSTNYGATWGNLGQQFGQTMIGSMVSLSGGVVVAGTYPNGYILRSTDYGATWSNIQTTGLNLQSMSTFIVPDSFTIGMLYKQAGGTYASVISALGDVGANIEAGSHTCYWDNPSQDRPNVEITDAQVQLQGTPDPENSGTYTLNITSAAQMTAGDGTGSQGDVKVEYEII